MNTLLDNIMLKTMNYILIFTLLFVANCFAIDRETFFPKWKSVNTDALIVKVGEKIIYESYARGYTKDTKHLSWSVAKSVAGILTAQAIEQGYLSLDEKLNRIFPNFTGDATVKDVLQMSSGIKFKEIYSGIPVTADVTRMLYLEGPKVGFANYTLSLPLRSERPGEHYYYSSGDTNVLMEILKEKLPKNSYDNFPWINLFDPLGIEVTFEQDSTGTFVGSSYLYMTARSYLKLSDLINNQGIYNKAQIIPKWYMELMKKVAPGVKNPIEGTSSLRKYSSQMTTNIGPEYGYLPKDALLMLGHQGQLVASSPKAKLGIVRLATDKGSSLGKYFFFKDIYETLKESSVHLNFKPTQNYLKKVSKNPSSALSFSDLFRVPKLITALAAKELCSCYYVVGRSVEQCRKDLKITLPLVPLVKVSNRAVKAFMHLGSSSIAKYQGKKFGCYLVSK